MTVLANWRSCLTCIFQNGILLFILYHFLCVFEHKLLNIQRNGAVIHCFFVQSCLSCLFGSYLLRHGCLSSVCYVLSCCPYVFSARLTWHCIYQHLSLTTKWQQTFERSLCWCVFCPKTFLKKQPHSPPWCLLVGEFGKWKETRNFSD